MPDQQRHVVSSDHPSGTIIFAPPTNTEENKAGFSPWIVLQAITQWWKVALPIGLLLATGFAAAILTTFTPLFESSTDLIVKERAPYIVFRENLDNSRNFLETQLKLMKTRRILSAALEDVATVPEIRDKPDAVQYLQKNLVIRPDGRSELVRVSYRGRTSKSARTVVDAVVNAYLDYTSSIHYDHSNHVISLLNRESSAREAKVQQLRNQVRDLHVEMAENGDGIIDPDVGNARSAVSLLEDQLVKAEVDYEVTKATLLATEQFQPEENPLSDAELDTIIDTDQTIVALQQQLMTLENQRDQIVRNAVNHESSTAFKSAVNRIEQHKQLLADMKAKTRQRIMQTASLNARAKIQNRIRELKQQRDSQLLAKNTLKARISEAAEKSGNVGGRALQLEFLRSELTREEEIHERIASRALQLTTETVAPPRVQRLDRQASLPAGPVELAPFKLLGLACCVGFLLPFGLAVVWEGISQRVFDKTGLKDANLDVLGEVAALPQSPKKLQATDRDFMVFQESVDSIRTALHVCNHLKDKSTLVLTSAISGEGKTTLSSQLAISLARTSGQRTVLIEADMRVPRLRDAFGLKADVGLSEVLVGDCTTCDALKKCGSHFYILPAGQLETKNPHKLLGSQAFAELISKLKTRFRYIVIDTPPILAASESLVVATHADATMLCARANYSRLYQIREAYDRLVQAEANPVGIVLNGVSRRSYGHAYGYDSQYERSSV